MLNNDSGATSRILNPSESQRIRSNSFVPFVDNAVIPTVYQDRACCYSGLFCVLALISGVAMTLAWLSGDGLIDACFEEEGGPYIAMSAYTVSFLDALKAMLNKECGTFHDDSDDCELDDTLSRSYGSSYFGLNRAVEVSWRKGFAELDPCIDSLLQREAPQSFFGPADILAASTLGLTFLALTACFGSLLVGYCVNKHKPRLGLQTPLQSAPTSRYYTLIEVNGF